MSLMLVVSMVAWFSYSQLALQCCSLAQRSKQAFLDIGHIDGRLCKNPLLSYKPCVGPCEPIVIAFAWLQAQQQAEQAQQEAARAQQEQQAKQAEQIKQAEQTAARAQQQAEQAQQEAARAQQEQQAKQAEQIKQAEQSAAAAQQQAEQAQTI